MALEEVYLFTGTEEVRNRTKMERILQNVDQSKTSITRYDADFISIQDIIEDAITIPFLSDKKVIIVKANDDQSETNAKHGLYRALIANLVTGVSAGFTKSITISGVGYKVQVQGNKVVLNIGFSHPVNMEIPQGLTVTCPTITEILVAGISKEQVGQFAADIKALKKVEPYHGYGIYYTNEHVRRKEIKKTSGKK
jgi:large subunit ribosomal protein L6